MKTLHPDRAITLAKFVKQEALGQKVPVLSMNADSVERAFGRFRVHTKYDVAEALTAIFPELAWTLPPRRKSWQNERHTMIVFDAVATGFAYWTAKSG